MKKNKKIILASVVITLVAGGIFAYGVGGKDDKVVVLDNQKSEIDSELAIKSMDNVRDFHGFRWLDDGRILGVKNQPLLKDQPVDRKAILSIYNPKDKSFEELVTANNEKEWILGVNLSEDGKYVFYSIGDDSMPGVYDCYVLDLNSRTTTKLAENVTSSSRNLVNNQIIVAVGMKVYKCDVDGNVEEISLPKELIDELQDSSSLEGESPKSIEANDNYRKQHNAIRRILHSGNKLFLQGNETLFAYDMDKKTYRVATEEERKEVYPLSSKSNTRVKIEFTEDEKAVLWKVNENGNKVGIIEEGYLIRVEQSPDNSKIAYYNMDKSGQYSSYVYDLNTDKKLKIFPDRTGYIRWNKTSKEFFMTSSNDPYFVTCIVKLND